MVVIDEKDICSGMLHPTKVNTLTAIGRLGSEMHHAFSVGIYYRKHLVFVFLYYMICFLIPGDWEFP